MAKQTLRHLHGCLLGAAEPDDARGWAVKNVGAILVMAAAVLVATVTACADLRRNPYPPPTRTADYLFSAAAAGYGLYLSRTDRHLPTWQAALAPTAAAILLCLPASAHQAPTQLSPMLLTWPVAFAAAVLPICAAWSTVAISATAFAATITFGRDTAGIAVWTQASISMIAVCWIIQRAQTHARRSRSILAAQARTDPLTGLLNRRAFDQAMAREHAHAHQAETPWALLLIDIDHFKRVNDTYGHQAGDATLRQLGRLLAETFRPTDIVGRVGGEEFAILLPGCDPTQATRRAHHLCETVRSTARTWDHAITVSIGVSARHDTNFTPAEVYAMADTALYDAKATGRNRVAEHPAPPTRK